MSAVFYFFYVHEKSLRLAPEAHPEKVMSTLNTTHTELGGHDALRFGTRSIKTEVMPGHPLEGRLSQVNSYEEATFSKEHGCILTSSFVVGRDTMGIEAEFSASSIRYARSY